MELGKVWGVCLHQISSGKEQKRFLNSSCLLVSAMWSLLVKLGSFWLGWWYN